MGSNLVKNLCGIADEAGSSLEAQIEAHRQLGWELIELRTVDGARVVDMTRDELNRIKSALRLNGLRVVAIDSGIGGWDRTVTTPFNLDTDELQRAIECAHLFQTRFLRIMSFANDGLPADVWRDKALERIAALVEMARAADVVLLHENCQGWASEGPEQSLEMLRQIDSPHLGLLFDTGNPIAYGQNPLSFVHAVAKFVQHVHIKDAVRLPGGEIEYTEPGAGQAQVALCLDALFRWGYHGAFSIEPHCAYVPHLGVASDESTRRSVYLSYAESFRTLLEQFVSPVRNFA